MYMLKHDQLSVDPNNITDDVHAVTALNYLWKFPKEEIEVSSYVDHISTKLPSVSKICLHYIHEVELLLHSD